MTELGVTAAQGFRAAGVTAGLKASGKPDVALVVNDGPQYTAAAVYTSNRCRAHPVLWSEQCTKDGTARAVVLNSGGANCYTGPEGFQLTHATAEKVAALLDCGPIDVLVCSTGLIGVMFAGDKLMAGIDAAHTALSADGGPDAATAIMTTDKVSKQSVRRGEGYTVGGMAKGAGMLAPGLATMLVVITTDAGIDPATADSALRSATRVTFDRLDSDGCMSTNDTVALLASGASGARPDEEAFAAVLTEVCADLAAQLLTDAEGADHDIRIEVRGAASESDAVTVARSVARNNLFKAAVFGQDPNWGRILAAVGTTDAVFDPLDLDVTINGVRVCRASVPDADPEDVDLSARAVHVLIDLKSGAEQASVYTNDLTHAYVHENSAYST